MNFEKRLIELSNILLSGGGKLNLSKEYVDKLKKIIRPDFFLLEKKSSILSKSASELFDYTEEQIATFDLLEDHPRLIIEGPMGTGKTAICEEIIKRKKTNKDLSILYINSTRLPNLEMKEKFINDKNVKCYTYNQFIKKIAQYSESTNLMNISDIKTLSFEDLNLKESLLRGVFSYGFENPSVIQNSAIPVLSKGKDVIADTYSKREGTVQTNFDGRQIGRGTKFKNKYVRQSQGKLDKANDQMAKFQKKYMVAGVDADGKPNSTFKAPVAGGKGFKRYSKLLNKQTENTNELKDFKAAAANHSEAVRSGKSIGSTTRRDVDRQDTAGDQTPDQRLAQVKAEKRASNVATEGGITTSNSQADGAITSTTPAMGGPKDQFNAGELEVTKFGEYTATSSPNNKRGYAMKGKNPAPAKSALKKSYFKNK